jgi:carbonic anhydrase
MATGSFATAINCMDGRVQCPVKHWLKDNTGAEYVDMITEPGADKLMADGSLSQREAVRAKVLTSVNYHKSGSVAVVGHHDCAGNPVAKEEHLKHIRKAMAAVTSWNLGVRVFGLWVNEKWEVEPLPESGD